MEMIVVNPNELRELLLHDSGVQEMIRLRAYEIFQMRDGEAGDPDQDWYDAEAEVLALLLPRGAASDNGKQRKLEPEKPSNRTARDKEPIRASAKPASNRRSTRRKSQRSERAVLPSD